MFKGLVGLVVGDPSGKEPNQGNEVEKGGSSRPEMSSDSAGLLVHAVIPTQMLMVTEPKRVCLTKCPTGLNLSLELLGGFPGFLFNFSLERLKDKTPKPTQAQQVRLSTDGARKCFSRSDRDLNKLREDLEEAALTCAGDAFLPESAHSGRACLAAFITVDVCARLPATTTAPFNMSLQSFVDSKVPSSLSYLALSECELISCL